MMKIIVEGPDGSGKSNLINRMLERYPHLKLMDRACTSEGGPIEDLANWVHKDLTIVEVGKWLYDRHPLISELIYGPALHRDLAKGFDEQRWLASAFQKFRDNAPLIIYCLPPKNIVTSNVYCSHGGTKHQREVSKNINSIYDLYHAQYCRDAYTPRRFVCLRWDYTEMDWVDFASKWLDSVF